MENDVKNKIYSVFERQKKYFSTGKTRNIDFKKDALKALKKSLIEHAPEIYVALEKDLGKTKANIDGSEIGVVLSEIDVALSHLDEWVVEQTAPVDSFLQPSDFLIQREPFGVSYIIGPFNYPINLTLAPVVGAIVSGCTAIIKPSENTPMTAMVIEKIIASAFPSEYLAVVQGAVEENSYLLSLPFDFIFFTGSPGVGKIVMKAASEHLTPVVLELGGKCPTIICPDADLDQVVAKVTAGKFANSGQTCVAPDYLLVHETVREALVNKLVDYVKHNLMKPGKIGKVVSQTQVDKILSYLEKTKGTIRIGGQADRETRYVEPAIVDNVSWDDALMQQELFAPILPVLTFSDLNSVAALVNQHHPKPLAAYIFTKNYDTGKRVLDQIPSGDAQINDVLNHAASAFLPFGGVGPSGMGEYHGRYSYEAFSHRKSIRITR
ncbi:NAD(P)-dependent benzaldehyde dehydrogenase MdlD [Bartonella sp. LJL80]